MSVDPVWLRAMEKLLRDVLGQEVGPQTFPQVSCRCFTTGHRKNGRGFSGP